MCDRVLTFGGFHAKLAEVDEHVESIRPLQSAIFSFPPSAEPVKNGDPDELRPRLDMPTTDVRSVLPREETVHVR